MQSLVTPILPATSCWVRSVVAAVTNQVAEVAFETVRHGTFLSARDHSGGLGTIIEEVAAPTKEHCYIDDRLSLSPQLDQMAITWTTLR